MSNFLFQFYDNFKQLMQYIWTDPVMFGLSEYYKTFKFKNYSNYISISGWFGSNWGGFFVSIILIEVFKFIDDRKYFQKYKIQKTYPDER